MRIWLAVRAFFRILFDDKFSQGVKTILSEAGGSVRGTLPAPTPTQIRDTVVDVSIRRSEAITLLATLQREARFVDMVAEPLADYSDAQVGAAARDVLRDCGRVLDRLFELRPLIDLPEGSDVEVPRGFDTGKYRLTGNVAGEPPFRGRLVHHGWIAERCELPTWSGSDASRMIVAPEEVELS